MDEATRAEPVQMRNLVEVVAYISRQHILGGLDVQIGEHGDGVDIVAAISVSLPIQIRCDIMIKCIHPEPVHE